MGSWQLWGGKAHETHQGQGRQLFQVKGQECKYKNLP